MKVGKVFSVLVMAGICALGFASAKDRPAPPMNTSRWVTAWLSGRSTRQDTSTTIPQTS